MPFGEKTTLDGRVTDFNDVYDSIIYPAITGDAMKQAGGPEIDCIRCDKIAQAGWIYRLMISQIYDADVAIVDLSTFNPNVFYELGVRHALRRAVTVLLCRDGTGALPFNIADFNYIKYDPDDKDSIISVRSKIAQFVSNGLKTRLRDSLVYEILEERGWEGPPPMPLDAEPPYLFRLPRVRGAKIGILTSGLQGVQDIDIWVNSENTNMQMARFFERSGSAVIRYYGARKDATGGVTEDTIANELGKLMKEKYSVAPGTIIVTSPGDLKKRGVKWIFHAAAVEGQLGRGYRPISDVKDCVKNALELASSPKYRSSKCKSILFPLFGTGTGGADVNNTVKGLISTAIRFFEQHQANYIQDIYFLALTDRQRDACLSALGSAGAEPMHI